VHDAIGDGGNVQRFGSFAANDRAGMAARDPSMIATRSSDSVATARDPRSRWSA